MAINFPIIFKKDKHSILVIDPSASHLGYAFITLDFDSNTMLLESSGMVWCHDSWTKGKRYRYMLNAIELLATSNPNCIPNTILSEAFFSNPRQMAGSAVIPTINGFIEMVCDKLSIRYLDMGATSWRAILGIKATKGSDGKRDYKTPTADLVKQFIKLPSEVPSNITRKMRTMPNDVTDVLAIALALARHHGINKATQANTAFYPFTLIEKLNKLSEEI
jgi:Holliday junction resolvasome RuvABC endonuclease subunit